MKEAIRASSAASDTAAVSHPDRVSRCFRSRSILVDFDGTACSHDVAEHVMERFGDPDWRDLRRDVDPWRDRHARLDPGAGRALRGDARRADRVRRSSTARWTRPSQGSSRGAQARDVPVTIVSDGLGLYVEPLLAAAGITGVAVITNDWAAGVDGVPQRPPGVRLVRHVQDACRAASARDRWRSSARGTPTATAPCTPTSCSPRTRWSVCVATTACRSCRTPTSTTCAARSRQPTSCPARWLRYAAPDGRRAPRQV